MREFEWIDRLLRPLATRPDALELQDDACFIPPNIAHGMVISTDTLVAGVHFFAGTDPALIARKALRVNLSDLAAMGASPYGYLLNLSLPAETQTDWMSAFCDGLHTDQTAFGIGLLGGDTTATSGPLSLSITAIGTALPDALLRRIGAQAGDDLYVSGTVGDGYVGLKQLQADAQAQSECVTRYHLPDPRLALGHALAGIANAAMDISDGLMQDAGHVCRASNCGMQINAAAIPLSDTARAWILAGHAALSDLISGGDDYELLFTASPDKAERLVDLAASCRTRITRIGRVTQGEDIACTGADGNALSFTQGGYRHF